MQTLGQRIKKLRIELDLNQQEFTKQFNDKYNYSLTKAAISHYETDKRTPEISVIRHFAEFFNVSLDYLLGASNIKNPNVEVYAQAFHSISTEELTQEEVDLLENMIEQFKKNRGIRK